MGTTSEWGEVCCLWNWWSPRSGAGSPLCEGKLVVHGNGGVPLSLGEPSVGGRSPLSIGGEASVGGALCPLGRPLSVGGLALCGRSLLSMELVEPHVCGQSPLSVGERFVHGERLLSGGSPLSVGGTGYPWIRWGEILFPWGQLSVEGDMSLRGELAVHGAGGKPYLRGETCEWGEACCHWNWGSPPSVGGALCPWGVVPEGSPVSVGEVLCLWGEASVHGGSPLSMGCLSSVRGCHP